VLRRIVGLVVIVPTALLLVTLAVANRHSVRLILDPFRPADPIIFINLPFYVYLLCALLIGVAIGGAATWLTQARWRRSARRRGVEAEHWHAEADRQRSQRARESAQPQPLLPANR
jgi:hypothetical protein